jgi:polyhydroxyalkanoate synthesis regulator phasin
MPIDTNLLDRLKSRGEEVFTQVSAELMNNPGFMKAMEGALKGKEKVDATAAQAIKSMNIPTRTEFKRALRRIDALEGEVADLKAKLKKAQAASRVKTKATKKASSRGTARKTRSSRATKKTAG